MPDPREEHRSRRSDHLQMTGSAKSIPCWFRLLPGEVHASGRSSPLAMTAENPWQKEQDVPEKQEGSSDSEDAVYEQLAQDHDVLLARLCAMLDVERGLSGILGRPTGGRPSSVGGSA